MSIIQSSRELKDFTLIETACKILRVVFQYQVGLHALKATFEIFFDLTAINQDLRIYTFQIFAHITKNIGAYDSNECFNRIDEAASRHASK